MNHEQLISTAREIQHNERTRPLDFATIRNPLGESPHIADNTDARGAVNELELVSDIASWLAVDESMITLGNGSDELIAHLPHLVMENGDTCMIATPTYFGLTDSLVASGNTIVHVPTRAEEQFAFSATWLAAFMEEMDRVQPALVWLCNPNNPTGTVMNLAQIETIVARTNALVIVDEAYQEIVDPTNKTSAVHLMNTHSNLLVTKTFSKAFGLPDIRIGIAIGNPELIRIIAAHTNPRNPSSLSTAAAALMDTDHLLAVHEYMTRESALVREFTAGLTHVELGARSQTGVCIFRHDAADLHALLEREGIQTKSYNQMPGLTGMRYVRLGLQGIHENRQLLAALTRVDDYGLRGDS